MKTTKPDNGVALQQPKLHSQKDAPYVKKNDGTTLSKKKFLTLHLAEEDAIFSLALLFFRKTL